jgi:hypothetical protein
VEDAGDPGQTPSDAPTAPPADTPLIPPPQAGATGRAPLVSILPLRPILDRRAQAYSFEAYAPDLAEFPAIEAFIQADIAASAEAFGEDAEGALATAGAGPAAFDPQPWAGSIQYNVTAAHGGLIGLTRATYGDTGGAHPNTSVSALVMDAATGQSRSVVELFAAGALPPTVVASVCADLAAQKRARVGEALLADAVMTCEEGEIALLEGAAQWTLAPSTEPGQFGGLLAFFPTYSVGPYVEGEYVTKVDQTQFRAALRPDLQPLFAGSVPIEPVREPEPMPE